MKYTSHQQESEVQRVQGAPGSEMWKPRGLDRASSWLISGLGLWLGSRPFSSEDGSGDGMMPEDCPRPSMLPTSSLLAELLARTWNAILLSQECLKSELGRPKALCSLVWHCKRAETAAELQGVRGAPGQRHAACDH